MFEVESIKQTSKKVSPSKKEEYSRKSDKGLIMDKNSRPPVKLVKKVGPHTASNVQVQAKNSVKVANYSANSSVKPAKSAQGAST